MLVLSSDDLRRDDGRAATMCKHLDPSTAHEL